MILQGGANFRSRGTLLIQVRGQYRFHRVWGLIVSWRRFFVGILAFSPLSDQDVSKRDRTPLYDPSKKENPYN
jgi:hypothetical protein